MHEHSGFSDGAPGTEPADYYALVKARGFDFTGGSEHSDSASVPVTLNEECVSFPNLPQCVQPSPQGVAKWDETLAQARAASDVSFTGFRGFEWTSDRFGHINVYFSRRDTNAKVDGGHVEMSAFWSWFITPPERFGGSDGLAVFNHPGREDQFTTGEPGFNWNDFAHVPAADARMVGIEVFNAGSDYGTAGPNAPAKGWYAHALDKGWHLGPIAGEDEHGTDWGAAELGKNVLIARGNSEAALREALLARRFYAVGPNHNDLRLSFTADGSPMGSRLPRATGATVSLVAAITAGAFTGTLELVSNGGEVVASATGARLTHTVTVDAAERWYFVRARGSNGRAIAYTSPIWIRAGGPNPPCGEWLPGDMHVHDDHSSDGSGPRQAGDQRGPGNVSVADQIGQGVQNGLKWMPLTDHRTYDQHYDPLWESGDLLLIPGEEANGSPHGNVLGAVDMIVQGGTTPGRPEFSRLQTSIWDAHSQGALWSHNHPDDGHVNDDDTPNERANALGGDVMEAWNGLTTEIPRKLKYAENRWNAGYRFGVVGASDNHFRELWAVAGPGLPATHALALQLNERAILQALLAGRSRINARANGSPQATLEADMDGDGIYEAAGGDEVIAATGTAGTLRVRVQLGAGATVSVYKSPGQSAGAFQTFTPTLPDQTFTANVTATDAQTWYYVEVRGPNDPDPMRVLTSPIFIGPALAEPTPAIALPPDAGIDDGARLVFGEQGQFNGFPDVAVAGDVTHIVAEQHGAGRTSVLYRRLDANGNLADVIDLAPGSGAARFPKVVARGNDVWIAWQDERAGQVPRRPAIYLRRSTDGGVTWQAETLLRQIDGRAEKPDLALTSDGQPIVVWQEISAGNPFDVMAQIVGTDASPVNLSRAGKVIVPANPADTRSSRYPASVWPVVTARADGLIAVGFQDNRTDPDPLWTGSIITGEDDATEVDNWQILVCTRAGAAGSWSGPASMGNDERADRHPALAFTPTGSLVAAWDSKTLNASGTNLSIRYSVSADDGVTWSNAANPSAIAEDTGVMSQYPKLAHSADGRVSAVWYDTRSIDWRWRVMKAVFDGSTWEGTLLMGRGINTWPSIDRGAIVFASTRNAVRAQRDRTQQIFALLPAAEPSASPSPTVTPAVTPTPGATASPTATATPTLTPTITPTVTPTVSPSASPSATPTATPSATASATPGATPLATPANVQLLNISGRVLTQTGDKVAIGGFIIGGTGTKTVIARAIGPSMGGGNTPVSGQLNDPLLELRGEDGRLIRSNDNWRDTQEQEIQESGLAPRDDRESAIIATLPAGTYTAVISGASDTTGIGLIEIYDLASTDPQELGNLSVRADVQTGDNVLIDGLILRGGNPQRILFRGIGPSLEGQLVDRLEDPTLELYDADGALLQSNNNWREAPNAAEIESTGLAPLRDREPAILLRLPPSNYTSILRGANGTTGTAVSEAYKLTD